MIKYKKKKQKKNSLPYVVGGLSVCALLSHDWLFIAESNANYDLFKSKKNKFKVNIKLFVFLERKKNKIIQNKASK